MFKNRVQVSRLSGVDGLVCDADNLELDAMVNWEPVIMFEQSRWAGRLTVGAPGDYPGDGILCALQTSDVFRRHADQNGVGLIKPRSDESTGDGFRHVLSEDRANMTHSPDMIESRLGDWFDMVVKSQMFVQRYPQYFDVVCQWNRWAGDVG